MATELEVETAGREDRTQAVECYRGNTMPSSVDHHIHLVRAHYLMMAMASFSFKLSGSSVHPYLGSPADFGFQMELKPSTGMMFCFFFPRLLG